MEEIAEEPQKSEKISLNPYPKKQRKNIFRDRNIIKKVKTNCLNLFIESIKNCLTNPK